MTDQALLLLSLPLLAPLILIRVLLYVASFICLSLICLLCTAGLPKLDPDSNAFPPLTGLRRGVMVVASRFFTRIMLLCFGVWPGMLSVSGTPDPAASVWAVAPHTGLIDALVFLQSSVPRPVMLKPYSTIPFIKNILQATGALLVPVATATKGMATDNAASTPTVKKRLSVKEIRESFGANPTSPSGKSEDHPDFKENDGAPKPKKTAVVLEAILEHKASHTPGAPPVCLLPEGTTHSGLSILTFFHGAFEGGYPVQLVAIKCPFKYYNLVAFLGSVGEHFCKLIAAPWLFVEISFLPTLVPTEEEKKDSMIMAERAREQFSLLSGLPLNSIGARELRKEAKEKAAAAKGKKLGAAA